MILPICRQSRAARAGNSARRHLSQHSPDKRRCAVCADARHLHINIVLFAKQRKGAERSWVCSLVYRIYSSTGIKPFSQLDPGSAFKTDNSPQDCADRFFSRPFVIPSVLPPRVYPPTPYRPLITPPTPQAAPPPRAPFHPPLPERERERQTETERTRTQQLYFRLWGL